jgi:hypothetical protein
MNKFHYSVVLSIILGRILEKKELFTILRFVTGQTVTDSNYLYLMEISRKHLITQFTKFSSPKMLEAVIKLDERLDNDEVATCAQQTIVIWLEEIKPLLHCDEWIAVKPLLKRESAEYIKFQIYTKKLWAQ